MADPLHQFKIEPLAPALDFGDVTLPVVGTDTTTQPGTQYLTLTYRKNSALAGTTAVMVQTSTDLQTWSLPQAPSLSQQVGTAANGDPMMEIGVRTNGTSTMFLRMSVTP